MKLRQIIRDYFSFNKNERIGLIILLSFILIVLIANKLIYYFETPAKADLQKFQQILDEIEIAGREKAVEPQFGGSFFSFDPNTIDQARLDSFRLPPNIKRNLLAYRAKGGKFYGVNDLRKIYGMNDSIFDAVKEYVHVELIHQQNKLPVQKQAAQADNSTEAALEKPENTKMAVQIEPVELNSATAADLEKLSGIGEKLSERIVKYRDLLGGFSELGQLSEVYGLKPETIERILPYLRLDSELIEKINVNFADAQQLAKHPYITQETARAIIGFRSQSGFINDISVLQLKNVLDESNYKKIYPYLKTK